jgi:hypothetical protein
MIEIKHLEDCEGWSKIGTCVSCGKRSEEDKTLTWITFNYPLTNFYQTICLCRKCRFKLASEILSDAAKEDGEDND